MKNKAKLISVIAVFITLCVFMTGCSLIGLGKPSSLEEYLYDDLVQRKLSIQVSAMNKLGNDIYDEVTLYVEEDTKLVYDFRFKNNPELNYLFFSDTIQETMNAPDFDKQFEQSLKDVRNSVGDGSITFIIRYRGPDGKIVGEKEVG